MTQTAVQHAESDDLRQLRESAEDFASRASPLQRARSLRNTQPGFERSFWAAIAQQGWNGLLAAEGCGGYAQGFVATAAVVQALARQVVPEPFVPGVVFAGRAIELSGAGDLQRRLLGQLVDGALVPVVAFEEHPAGLAMELRPVSVGATEADGRVTLQGTKFHVRAAGGADGFVVSARCAERDEMALYWVPRDTAGVSVAHAVLADGTSSGTVRFERATIPSGQLLAQGSAALDALTQAFDEALLMTAAELLGLQRAMLALSLDYLRSRNQFGRPIGAFQALQHRAVDLLIQQELTAAVVNEVASSFDRQPHAQLRSRDASRAKARAASAALQIGKESIQLHGAIGFTDEYDLGLYFQRCLVLSAWLGNALIHRRRHGELSNVTAEQQR